MAKTNPFPALFIQISSSPLKISLIRNPSSSPNSRFWAPILAAQTMASNSDKNVAASEELSRKKRPALADVTNLKNFSRSTLLGSSKPMVPCVAKIAKTKNEPTEPSKHTFPASSRSNSVGVVPPNNTNFPGDSECSAESTALPSSSNINVPLGESLSSIEGKTSNMFSIPDDVKRAGDMSKRSALVDGKTTNQAIEMDILPGTQFLATTTSDIYKHLRESEVKYRPSMEFIERIQIDINPSMRATLIDWLVEVSEEYRLVRDTLFLTVNYIDRYLSGKVIRRQKLQLLGVACMMIAAKYEEISPPRVEEFCYITDNTYLKEEILSMETAVLDHLKFEMAAPMTICFLRRFISAAPSTSEVLYTQLECMANYIAELSLLNFSLLHYPPSLVAASATFLASYLLSPYNRPWNSTLMSCTMYQPSDLCDCVKVLLHMCRCGGGRNLSAIRNKYSHHKYKCVAKKYCPSTIPVEFFEDM